MIYKEIDVYIDFNPLSYETHLAHKGLFNPDWCGRVPSVSKLADYYSPRVSQEPLLRYISGGCRSLSDITDYNREYIQNKTNIHIGFCRIYLRGE